MNVLHTRPIIDSASSAFRSRTSSTPGTEPAATEKGELRATFDQFVGQTFYSQMLAAMRQTVGEPAYFHGGRAEKAFQGQLDQILSEKLAETTSDRFTGPMFELFSLSRQ